jgi:hypothetical protein
MRNSGRCCLAVTLLAALCAGHDADGVSIDPRGLGQVLVYPYYSANSAHATLLSVANTSARGKALKVRFHEGYDGRPVLDFDLYLGPHDTWVGEVADRFGTAESPATLFTNDTSCTVPAFAPLPGSATLRYLDFNPASYAGENTFSGPTGNSDGGPTGPGRTREGHFDVFEMGEVTDAAHATLQAITPVDGVPGNCAQVVAAWAGGYWGVDPRLDLDVPRGGLFGSEAVIDVGQGTMYAFDALAIGGFSTAVQHGAPGSAQPDFDTASRGADGNVAAFVTLEGSLRELDYANPVDAVSALFMTDALYNEFSNEAALGAHSDWVVTAPTKRFYVDPVRVGVVALPPFQRAFEQGYTGGRITNASTGAVIEEWGSSFPYACDTVGATVFSRSGSAYPVGRLDSGGVQGGSSPILSSQALTPCLETSVLTFAAADTRPGGEPISVLGSALTDASDPGDHVSKSVDEVNAIPFETGNLHLDLLHDLVGTTTAQHRLTAATNGDVLLGLPLVGFVAEDFINGDVSPGVLANYSGAYPHRAASACTNALQPQGSCP